MHKKQKKIRIAMVSVAAVIIIFSFLPTSALAEESFSPVMELHYGPGYSDIYNYESIALAVLSFAKAGLNSSETEISTNIFVTKSEFKELQKYFISYFLGEHPTYILRAVEGDSRYQLFLQNNQNLKNMVEENVQSEPFFNIIMAETKDLGNEDKIAFYINYLKTYAEYDNTFQNTTVYELITQRKAVCNSFTVAFTRLCNQSGIECRYVFGELNGISHAWNEVKTADGIWKYVDVTNPQMGTPYIDESNYCGYKMLRKYAYGL